jgi:selenoprotein W-related protein
VSLAEELLKEYEHVIEAITLVPAEGGKFEVSVNRKLIFSKTELKRHAEAGEILNLISKLVD